MNRVVCATLLSGLIFVSGGTVSAATVPDGEIIVRVEDGSTSRCINASTDRITMNLRRLVIDKDVGIFTEDKLAGVLISTIISGDEITGIPRKVSFPRMYTVTVAPYAAGYVSLPVEEKLFSRFALTNDGNSYDTAELEFSIIFKRDKTPFGIALSALEDISKTLPTPINPFSESFKYFAQYANKVVDGSLSKEHNVAASSREGKIIMTFSSTGTCTGDQEKTGTLAVVKGAAGKESDGYVDIKKQYCWTAELKPVYTLKFAPPKGTGCKDIASDAFKRVSNPYVAFYLNAEPRTLTSSRSPQARVDILPRWAAQPVDLQHHEIDAAVATAYKTGQTDATARTVASKVKAVLGSDDKFLLATRPLNRKENVVTWTTTASDSLAFDISESLRRCAAHGVPAQSCL